MNIEGTEVHTDDNGQFHRDDGPAVTRLFGTREWYRHGQRHRADGPAVEHANGEWEIWREGKFIVASWQLGIPGLRSSATRTSLQKRGWSTAREGVAHSFEEFINTVAPHQIWYIPTPSELPFSYNYLITGQEISVGEPFEDDSWRWNNKLSVKINGASYIQNLGMKGLQDLLEYYDVKELDLSHYAYVRHSDKPNVLISEDWSNDKRMQMDEWPKFTLTSDLKFSWEVESVVNTLEDFLVAVKPYQVWKLASQDVLLPYLFLGPMAKVISITPNHIEVSNSTYANLRELANPDWEHFFRFAAVLYKEHLPLTLEMDDWRNARASSLVLPTVASLRLAPAEAERLRRAKGAADLYQQAARESVETTDLTKYGFADEVFRWFSAVFDVERAYEILKAGPREPVQLDVATWAPLLFTHAVDEAGVPIVGPPPEGKTVLKPPANVHLEWDHVRELSDDDKARPGVVVPFYGTYLIIDGHHRLAKRWLDHDQYMPALLLSEAETAEITKKPLKLKDEPEPESSGQEASPTA